MSDKLIRNIQALGAVMVVTGVAVRFFEVHHPAFKYVYSTGALMLIVVAFIFNHRARNESVRVQRQHRLMLIATAFLGIGAYLMFKNDETWVVAVLLYAVISVFLTFRGEKNSSA